MYDAICAAALSLSVRDASCYFCPHICNLLYEEQCKIIQVVFIQSHKTNSKREKSVQPSELMFMSHKVGLPPESL